MRRRKICLVLILFILLNSVAISVYANDKIEDAKNNLEDINDKLKETKEMKKKLEKQVQNVSAEIKKLDIQMEKAQENLEEVQESLNKLNQDIENTKEELKEAEEEILDKQSAFNSRLRVMYKNSGIGYLEVLLNAKDFKDLLTRLDMVQKIIDYDVSLIKYLKEQKELIEEKKQTLEQKYAETEVVKKQIDMKTQELEIATRSKERLMAKLTQDKKEYERLEDELLREAKAWEERIKKLQMEAKYAGGEMQWPVPGRYYISSNYGYRTHPIYKIRKMHTGIDIPAPTGHNIVAANSGKVIAARFSGGYGNVVVIDHGGGITTLYAHNSKIVVKVGQWVKKGQVIAKAGTTGNSTGPHLHFEVRKDGGHTNPLDWVTSK